MNLISKTIGDCIRERAGETPDLVAMSHLDDVYTWREIDEISDFLAVKYLHMGIKKGTHAGLLSVNSPNWVFAYLALVKIGAVAVLVNTCYKKQELEVLFAYSDLEYLFFGSEFRNQSCADMLDSMECNHMPKLRHMIALEPEYATIQYHRSDYPDDMPEQEAVQLQQAMKQVSPMNTACILFTSGTTNIPKGVMLSHHSLVNNALEIGRNMHWSSQDKMCIAVPLFHCFGITAGILSAIQMGTSFHLLKYYKTIEVLEQVERHRCTILNGVPTMFLAIINNQKRATYDLSSVQSGILAGSAIGAEEYQQICEALHLKKLQVSYGQTESSPCITISDFEDSTDIKSTTVGKKIANIELMILNLQTGQESDCGEVGEILTKGYHVMQGYYNMPEETKQTMDGAGWLHTGDLGYLDELGYLHVTGRMKEMIIRGGENISPLEIERCISCMPCVEQVKVLGIKAKVLQEEIVACIIPKVGMSVDKEKVRAFVEGQLADYKVPKYIMLFSEFPLTSSGKIQVKELCKQIEQRKEEEERTCFLQNSMN